MSVTLIPTLRSRKGLLLRRDQVSVNTDPLLYTPILVFCFCSLPNRINGEIILGKRVKGVNIVTLCNTMDKIPTKLLIYSKSFSTYYYIPFLDKRSSRDSLIKESQLVP